MKTSFESADLRRGGFTLIELLTVIAILSILMAFLIPAVMNARKTAVVAQVTNDILTLDNAIKSFKNEFGVEPPSSITLCEVAADWSASATNRASMAIIGRLWPQFDFTLARDFNLDGDGADSAITLTGPECLVFFLGGVTTFVDGNNDRNWDTGETVITVNGFSRNPADPFAPMASGAGNRQGPFYTFSDLTRLIAIRSNTNTTPIAFTFGYADPITGTKVPYLYASSNDGQGYNEDAPSTQVALDFAGVNDARGTMASAYTAHYYRQGTDTTAVPSTSPFWNKNGYQIVSAGFDRRFGGPSTGGTAPFHFGGAWQKGTDLGGTRDAERDNITNFSNGLLVP